MTRLRAVVLGAVLWCGVVVAVSSLVWVVISRAGQGVVPVSQPQADAADPSSGFSLVPRHGPPSRGVTLTPRPSASSSPTSTTSSPPVVPPVVSPSSSPTSAPSSSKTPPVGPTTQRRSWSGSAGHVAAQCRGTSVRLVSAFPNADWRYAVLDRGPVEVRVRFNKIVGDDKSGSVVARCASGVPHFSLSGDLGGDE